VSEQVSGASLKPIDTKLTDFHTQKGHYAMKKILCASAALLVASVVLTGCLRGDADKAPAADSFTLKPPSTPTAIKPGETQTVKVTLNRGKDFKQDVKLTVADLPKGITVDLGDATVKSTGNGESEVKIKADNDAAPGEAKLTITATPDKGQPAKAELKIKVEKADKPMS